MDVPTIPDQMFLLIILIIVAIVLIVIVFEWRKVAQSKNSILMLEKEIELKKMSMVENPTWIRQGLPISLHKTHPTCWI